MKVTKVVAVILLGTSLNVHAVVVAPGFQETVYAMGMSVVTGMGWAPDGSNRLFVIQQNGVIRVVKDGALLPTPFASVSPVFFVSQAGLLGLCFDPNYVVNRFVYVLVTTSATEQRILRFTDNNNVGTNLFVMPPTLPAAGTFHNGGALGFGFDGKLYWAIGEFLGGPGVDANLTLLTGKAGRANFDGTVPLDNPFFDGTGPNNDYIWGRGLRNPFKFAFNPFDGGLWVNIPGDNYEQIFLLHRGDHAGWDNYENNQPAGFITPKIKYRSNGTDTRNIAGGGAVRNNNVTTFTTTGVHGFRQGERITIMGVNNNSFNGIFPVVSIPSATTFVVSQTGVNANSGGGLAMTQFIGGAVTGGCFYDSTAFPAAFRTNLFFCDYLSGRVMRATINANNEVLSVDDFATGLGELIDIATGPDGAIYYCTYNGMVFRAAFNNTTQGLIVRPAGLNMKEGGEAVFTVRLATAITNSVAVGVARSAGDSDISTTNTTLVFAATNFSAPQTVKVVAAVDADFQNDQAQFSVSAPVATTQTVSVHAFESQGVPSFTSITKTSNGASQMRLNAGVGKTYVLEGTTNLVSWLPLSTNVASTNEILLTDADTTNRPFRCYRVRSTN